MANHVAADRVKETTTTAGTGNVTLSGAATGYTTFASVMANSDTTFYAIQHQTLAEWEIGYGTFVSATPALARTTVIRSSNADSAVNFSVGTKDVFIASPASLAQTWGLVIASPATKQDNYAPTGLALASNLSLTPTASVGITGLTGGYYGRRLTVHNDSTDYLVWLEHENTASSAANRFNLPHGFPAFLLPGDHLTLHYDAIAQRWEVEAWPNQGRGMGLTAFTDCLAAVSAAAPTTSGACGEFAILTSGTGATAQDSTYLVGTTEKPMGVVQVDTGTTTTGRAHIGLGGTAQIVPTLGPALSVVRLAVETTVSGTETFTVLAGFHDAAGGTWTDGAAWENRWTGAAAEWSQTRQAGAVATRSNTGSPASDNNYIWLIVFMNAGWTRADFIYSTDSIAFTKADSPTTGLPGNTQYTSFGVSIIKSAGTTARNLSIDLMGFRADYVRG